MPSQLFYQGEKVNSKKRQIWNGLWCTRTDYGSNEKKAEQYLPLGLGMNMVLTPSGDTSSPIVHFSLSCPISIKMDAALEVPFIDARCIVEFHTQKGFYWVLSADLSTEAMVSVVQSHLSDRVPTIDVWCCCCHRCVMLLVWPVLAELDKSDSVNVVFSWRCTHNSQVIGGNAILVKLDNKVLWCDYNVWITWKQINIQLFELILC